LHLQYRNIKGPTGTLSREFVLSLRDAFGVRCFVETGTYLGDTLAQLADDFESLHSIELSSDCYAHASARFADKPQIRLVNADSTSGLDTVLRGLSEDRALFWLDAHYSGGETAKGQSNTPVKAELETILAHPHRNDIILVDDLRYFWQVLSGFRQHEAISGYPSAAEIVQLLNNGARQYDCFVLSDALLAVPSHLWERHTASAILQALTQSRQGAMGGESLAEVERVIAAAAGSELHALLEIPQYLAEQNEYGLGGHYYYWRALVRLRLGQPTLAKVDSDIAARCGVIPDGSSLARPLAPRRPLTFAQRIKRIVRPAYIKIFEARYLRRQLADLETKHNRWAEAEPLIESLLRLSATERASILSTDQLQYAVGTTNQAARDAWVSQVLSELPSGARLLDAGAGECQYKKHCGHLQYVAQDNAIYDGRGGEGLHTGSWNVSQIDIVSDILAIPEPDASFDAILCTEVLEHVPDPIRAVDEMARLLRPGGSLIITAPFWSLTHFAPYHYVTGFNRHFYEHHLGRLGFGIVDMIPNGSFFESIGQELRRVEEVSQRFVVGDKPSVNEAYGIQFMLSILERMSRHDTGSHELLSFGYHLRAIKHRIK
jgi:SAM-dependent methyltransferase